MTTEQYERFIKIRDFLKSNFDKREAYKIIDKDKRFIIIDLKQVNKRNQLTYALIKKLDKLKDKNLKLDFDNKIDIAIIKNTKEVKKNE